MIFLAATQSDNYRKPALGMWEHLRDKIFEEFKIDMKESFYCGDAAGRPKTATRPKDFTDTDLKFALNISLSFKTPEGFFLGEKELAVTKIENFFKRSKS
jgi:bifunctional polynucleotide phosphatase/kinase